MFFRMRSFPTTHITGNSGEFHKIKTLYEVSNFKYASPSYRILVMAKSYYVQEDIEVKMYFVHETINNFNSLLKKGMLPVTILTEKINFRLRRY